MCSGCGYCCAVQPCAIAVEFLGVVQEGVCPALERNGETGGTACGLIVRPLHYLFRDGAQRLDGDVDDPALRSLHDDLSKKIALSLGAGRGCDSEDDAHSLHWPWPVVLLSEH